MILKLESILSDRSSYIWIAGSLICLSLSGTTFAYVLMSNKKKFIATRSYLATSTFQFVITYGAVYVATLIGLWLHGAISIQGVRFSITSIDAAILLYSSFLYPILKIVYDYLGIILDDGVDFQKFHRSATAFLDRFEVNCKSQSQIELKTEIDVMCSQLKVMKDELYMIINTHSISYQDTNTMKVNQNVEVLVKFFKEYKDKPTQRKPDIEAFFSGSRSHSDIRIQESLNAVWSIREMKQLW